MVVPYPRRPRVAGAGLGVWRGALITVSKAQSESLIDDLPIASFEAYHPDGILLRVRYSRYVGQRQ